MHHYEFNIGDYRKDTGHLSLLEHGIYRMLLDSYYTNEGPLDADDAKLMRTHCIRSADEQQAYRNVMEDFFDLRDGSYHHDGCDKVLNKIYEKSASARASAKARWDKKNANALKTDANAMQGRCDPNANDMLPITHNPEPITQDKTLGSSAVADKPPSKIEIQFEAIWQAYPKREGSNPKSKALSAFKARIAEGIDPADMAAGVNRYLRYCQARGSIGTEYVMQAARFFGKGKEFENDWMITETGDATHKPSFAKQSKSDRDDEAMRAYLEQNAVTGSDDENLADIAGMEAGYIPGRQH